MSLFDAMDQWSEPFVHKRLLGAVGGFIGGGPGGAIKGFIGSGGGNGGRRRGRADLFTSRGQTARLSSAQVNAEQIRLRAIGRPDLAILVGQTKRLQLPSAGAPQFQADPCPRGRMIRGTCVNLQDFAPGGPKLFTDPLLAAPVGDAVMGRYGAALTPGSMVIDRAVCLPGMVLGDDDLCYNKGQISNKQRQWPRGRRPLLTGGEMRSISVAARAAGRLERTTKRLQKIGLMKKPRR